MKLGNPRRKGGRGVREGGRQGRMVGGEGCEGNYDVGAHGMGA